MTATRQQRRHRSASEAAQSTDRCVSCGLTKKAEPPPTRGVDCNRSGNGGWLRRLVRRHHRNLQIKNNTTETTTTSQPTKLHFRSERSVRTRTSGLPSRLSEISIQSNLTSDS